MEWKILDNRPIWAQLQEQLTLRIIAGTYPLGSRLPSVRELAAEAGVNPNTMQRALSSLEGSGLVDNGRFILNRVYELGVNASRTLNTKYASFVATVVEIH